MKIDQNTVMDWVRQGIDLFKANWMTLTLASIVVYFLSLTVVLAGPMYAGLIFMTLAIYDKKEPPPHVMDVFKGFSYFVPALLFVVVWGLASALAVAVLSIFPVVGTAAGFAATAALATAVCLAPFFIVEQSLDFWQASKKSAAFVWPIFGPFFLLSCISSLIAFSGVIVFTIGVVVTLPIGTCILTVAYRQSGASETSAQPPAPVEPE
ncbi:MAG: hypothetical protein AB1921_11710 [Thermodesulfobacteriota bacterium]